MIKAQDLRLNNYIRIGDKTAKITCLSLDGVSAINKDTAYIFEDFNDIIGIELTPDILLKAGFQETINNRDSGYKQIGKNIRGHDFMFTIECNHTPEFYFDMVGVDIQYLHQLQNLYYSLTGEELTITLT